MNNLPKLLSKISPMAIIISKGLAFFYVICAIFLITQGMYLNAFFSLVLALVFVLMVFLNKISQFAQNKVKKIATVLSILKDLKLEKTEENKSKIILFLFNLDLISFKSTNKTINEVFWFKKNHRPYSDLVERIVDSFLAKTLTEEYVSLSESEVNLIEREKSLLNLSLLEINAKIREEAEMDKISEDTLIRFK